MNVAEKAARASGLLRDPLLIEVLDGIEDDAVSEFRSSAPGDDRARTIAYHKLKSVEAVRDRLEGFLTDLKIAER